LHEAGPAHLALSVLHEPDRGHTSGALAPDAAMTSLVIASIALCRSAEDWHDAAVIERRRHKGGMLVDIDLTARIVMLIFNIMYISKLRGLFLHKL
jgi:hypothetical protein